MAVYLSILPRISMPELQAVGDVVGSSSHFGSCCVCRMQFMSTAEQIAVIDGERHCYKCAGYRRVAPISLNGDTWNVLSLGTRHDGKVYAHLASTTRSQPQRNGARPIQMADWIPVELLRPIP